MWRARALSLATAVLMLTAAVHCGGAAQKSEAPVSPGPASPTRLPQRERPVRVIDIDLNSCMRPPGADDRFRVIAHEKNAKQYLSALEQAMAEAIDRSAYAYGWVPEEPICVHVFSSDNAYIQGLQQLGGIPPADTFENRKYLGRFGVDVATGHAAIFLNAIISLGPNWVPYLATHEYFHIVQEHVRKAAFPIWFLEGMAEWEALRLQGEPRPTSLGILLTEERVGRSHPLSALETWQQWRGIDRGASPYFKAKVAIMYLERLAGPEAPIRLLIDTTLPDPGAFDSRFRKVSGVTMEQFEAGIADFLEALIQEQLVTTTPAP